MEDPTINLLHPRDPIVNQPEVSPRKPRRRWRGVLMSALIFFIVLGGSFFVANIVVPGVRITQNFGSENLLKQLTHLTFSRDRSLAGEDADRVNVLILGIGGPGHEGPLLTDTIILASLELSTGRTALMSIPRDLFIPYPDGSWRKINEVYIYGERANSGDGGVEAASAVAAVLGISIPYYALVDFSGFQTLVESVNGVNVYVERSFTDSLFPTDNDEDPTQSVTFASGWQSMNGKTALMYARSRHGDNGEGSDFARARRQQKIILALKDRILSADILANPFTMNRLSAVVADNLQTNLEPWEAVRFYKLVKNVNSEHVIRVTLDASPGGLLVNGVSSAGAYILQPRGGDFREIQTLTQKIFTNDELVQEPARLEVLNGTTTEGLAAETAKELIDFGYKVVRIANSQDQTLEKTRIYDFTNGTRPTSLAALKLFLNAEVDASVPPWLVPSATSFQTDAPTFQAPAKPPSQADFVVILGTDAAPTAIPDTPNIP